MNLEKQSQIKTLIARGKEKGYLTYAEVTDHLPEIVDSEQLDDVISMINSMGIVVHDEAPDEDERGGCGARAGAWLRGLEESGVHADEPRRTGVASA